MPDYFRYPLDESTAITNKVKFTATLTGQNEPVGAVQFYTPTNLMVADGAAYGSIDLGMLGGIASQQYDKAKESFGQTDGTHTGFLNSVGDIAGNLWSAAKTQGGAAGEAYILNSLPENISKQVTYNAKQVVNPHTMTTFQSVNIRSFTFTFKMIAESQTEAIFINNIDRFFRQNLYPTLGGGGVFQIFPPIWKIQFFYDGTENFFLPKIHDCFLTSYSSAYNEEFSSFHRDGTPFSIASTMQFTETKPYDRDTILGESA